MIRRAQYMRMVAQWMGRGKSQAEAELAVDEAVLGECRLALEGLVQHYADGLIEIAVAFGPRLYSGTEDDPEAYWYDPVTDPGYEDGGSAAYCTAARKLGIL